MEIKVNKIDDIKYEAFDPNGKSLGFLNYFEFNDLRIQIKENNAEGYYLIFKGEDYPSDVKVCIKKNGKTDRDPKGFYDLVTIQLRTLLDLETDYNEIRNKYVME